VTPRIITAAEAASLLEGRNAKGAWRVGGVEAEGKVWAHDPTALGGPSVGEVCIFNANTYRPHNGNRALAAAAPDLAATVIAQAAEIERLRAIVDGRATPPTDAEIAAHEAAGGWWRCAPDGDRRGLPPLESFRSDTARAVTSWAYVMGHTIRWWALDAQCRPCAWPVVKAKR